MRLKILVPAVIVLMTVLAILFWLYLNPASAKLKPVEEAAQSGSLTNAQMNGSASNPAASPSTAASTEQKTLKLDRNNPESIRQYLLSQNVPVEFYGRVIDQDGNPIAGAKASGEVLHVKVIVPAPGGAQDEVIPINQETDSNGRFEIRGMTGRCVDLKSVQKDGYEVEPDYCPHAFAAASGTYDNPMVFKMWSANIHEKLIGGEKSFQIMPDGRVYFINLTDDTIAESGSGDLKVWIKRPNVVSLGQKYNWACEVDVVDGGLCKVGSYSMFSAPIEGYEPSFHFEQTVGSGWGDTTGEKRFYLELKNGQIYGRMVIELCAYYNERIPALIRLSYAINPSGSRILR